MNNNEKYVEDFVKDIPFDAPDEQHRDKLKKQLLNAFPKHRLQPAAQTVEVWRTILRGKVPKLAAAAVIVFAAFLAVNLFNKTSSIVWAEVARRLADIKTVAYKITADVKGMPGTPEEYITHIAQDVTVSYEQNAVRIDSAIQSPRGIRNTYTHILFKERRGVTIMPDQKKYIEVNISDEQMKKMEEEKGDPVTLLNAMLEYDYTELGRRRIDGIMAWGIEVSDPMLGAKMGSFISGGMFDETIVRLWVDEKNKLPIRITATGSSTDGRASMEMVIDNFQWDIAIDPEILKPVIPEDFELLAQTKWETGNEGEEIIDILRLFLEFADGKYPSSLKTMTVANAIAPILKEKFSSGPPDKELIARLMKIDRVGMMYTTLEKEGREPAYYGDIVSSDLPDAVLFRWKIDDKTYSVVFGDLRVEDVTTERLAELEQSALQ